MLQGWPVKAQHRAGSRCYDRVHSRAVRGNACLCTERSQESRSCNPTHLGRHADLWTCGTFASPRQAHVRCCQPAARDGEYGPHRWRGRLQEGTQADVAALLLGSIGHLLTNDDAIQCFTATAAALRPGGLLIVELPSPEDLFDGAFIVGDAWDAQLAGQDILISYGQDDDPFNPISQVRYNMLAGLAHATAPEHARYFLSID